MKMNRRTFIQTLAASGSVLALPTAAFAASSPKKLKLIGTLPIKSYGTTDLGGFKKSVEATVGDRLTIELYPAQQLYNDTDAPNVIPNGSVDMGVVNTDFWTGKDPAIGILMIPILYESYDHFYKARNAMLDTLDASMQKRANCKIVGWLNYSTQTIASTYKISTIKDFSGKRFRGWGQYSASFFKYAGGSAVIMSSGDVYDALSKGAIDGEMSAWVSQLDRKFYEVAKYMLNMSLLPVTNYAVVVNKDVWEKLSKDEQAAIKKAGANMDMVSRKQNETDSAAAIKKLKDKGVTITDVSDQAYQGMRNTILPKLKEDYIGHAGDLGQKLWKIVESSR